MTRMWNCLLVCGGTLAGIASAVDVSAQAPKAKFSAQQIAQAEKMLQDSNCSLHREEDKFQIKGGKLIVIPSSKQVDHLAFPEAVKDAELAKLLPHAARLPNLRSIDMGRCANISEKGLGHLKLIPELQALYLDHTPATGQWLAELVNLKSLEWLDLSGTPLSDDAIKKLGDIKLLNTLVIRQLPNLTPDGIKNIIEIEQLRTLDVTIERNPDKMAEALSTAKSLVSLKVSPVSDQQAPFLARMTGIQSLDVSNNGQIGLAAIDRMSKKMIANAAFSTITGDGVKLLVGCTSLRSLNLAYTPTTGHGFDALTVLKDFAELNAKGTDWDNEGIAAIARIPTIAVLDLRSTKVTDAGLENLADLPALERLYLGYNSITDAGLTCLTQVRSLRSLDLSSTRVRVVDAHHLDNFAILEQLHLQSTAVNHEAIAELGKIKSLRYLNLKDNCPALDTDDEAQLKKDLPNTLIAISPCASKLMTVTTGWPGSRYYAFRLPDFKYPPPAPTYIPPMKLPPQTEKLPAPPPAIRIPSTGGSSPKP